MILSIMVGIALSGCASGRLTDLADCGRCSIGAGLGLSADVKIGELTQPAIGAAVTYRVGLESRSLFGAWKEAEAGVPFTMIAGEVAGNRVIFMSYGRVRVLDDNKRTEHLLCGYWGPWDRFAVPDPERSLPSALFHTATDQEVGATLAVVSARVGIKPLEIVDFLLGFVGVDLAGDDPKKAQEGTGARTPSAASHQEDGDERR